MEVTMGREEYVNTLLRDIVGSQHDRIKQIVQPNVDDELKRFKEGLENTLKHYLKKHLNQIEQRLRMYAKRWVSNDFEDNRFSRMRRSISKIEKLSQANFIEGEKEIFDRKVARNHRHRQALKKCLQELAQNLNIHSTDLLDVLYRDEILSEADLESVRHKTTPTNMNDELLQILCGRLTVHEFNDVFLPALEKDHPHLVQMLVHELARLEEDDTHVCVACRIKGDVQVKHLARPLLWKNIIQHALYTDLRSDCLSNSAKWTELEKAKVTPSQIISALKDKYPDFHHLAQNKEDFECSCADQEGSVVSQAEVVEDGPKRPPHSPEDHIYDSISDDFSQNTDIPYSYIPESIDEVPATEYKTRHTKRGLCLVINNIIFLDDRLTERSGSQHDSAKLTTTFQKLGFEVIVKLNRTVDDIMCDVQAISKQDHSNYDAFVCCLLSHGRENRFYGVDGTAVHVSNILKEFNATNCPTLAGKPKMFFIQSDRGREHMAQCEIGLDPTAGAFCGGASAIPPTEGVPDEADFLIGYCTPPGFSSFRSTKHGSWYIQSLCSVLERHADRHDVLSCMLMVNEEVSRNKVSRDKNGGSVRRQIPAPVFTLRKKLHLTLDPSGL